MRVWAAFMNDPGPAAPPSPPTLPTSSGQPPPPLAMPGAPGAAPPPVQGPSAGSPFHLTVTNLVGPETNLRSVPGYANPQMPRSIPVPGLGMVDVQQAQASMDRITAVLQELTGSDVTKGEWTEEQVARARANLPAMYAQGRLTEEQYQALEAAIDSVRP
jgi:hypothetical protein